MYWLDLIVCSFMGAVIWTACYFVSANVRIKRANKKGEKPDLVPCRVFYIVTGILGQVIFWFTVYRIRQLGEMMKTRE